ncbi:hypothetical protein CPB97_009445 [Podila verticillata]|nr:hypothetical protein CPB97_009445 [Podila verticillata]
MKRSNDYAQSHDAFKKPRVAQGYNNNSNNNNNYNHGGMGGHGSMGGSMSSDMYGSGGYGSNPMMMGGYGHMGSQYGSQYGGNDQPLSLPAPYQQYPAPSFGTGYGNAPFQVSFPPNAGSNPSGNRTVYIGNVPADATIEEVLNTVRTGIVESARLLPEKNCAFVSFMDGASAAAYHQEANTRKVNIGGQDLKVGWGKPSAIPPQVLHAAGQGATRNVFLGNVDPSITEQGLREDFSQYGPIDTIKVLHEKNIAFVHFTTINNAVKAVANLPNDPKYSGRRVNYGKDRCAKNNNMGNNNSNNNGAMSNSFGFNASPYPQYGSNMPISFNPSFDRFPGGGRVGMPRNMFNDGNVNPLTAQGNRTLYLGNIAPETTCEDICNHIRGGILNSIRYFPNKHIAFVSFVDPQAANNFFNQATYQGVTIKNRRLKVGWGQNAHALPAPVIQALSDGATRNVYVGGIDDSITEEKLREDFAEYGETELVNILKEKSCGFVNFTNVMAAVKAVEGIKSKAGYENVRVNFGKDRCGNPPKTLKPYSHNNSNNTHNSNNHSSNNSNGTGVKHESSDDRVKSDPTESDVKDFEDDDEMFQVGA